MKRIFAFVFTFFIASATLAETINVAAAISLKDALAKTAAQYKSDTGETVEFTLGSSGQLANQIANGAPIDLFVSAANKQVDDLAKAGIVDAATRKVIAGNSLVVIIPRDGKSSPATLKELTDPAIAKIAVGEPKTVPAGQYAAQAFKHAGVSDALKDKLIFGTNVRQVLDYVERGEVSAGLVYGTDAKIAGGKVHVTFVVDAGAHEPIVYPAVIVKASAKRAASARFADYILSAKGQASMKDFGFTPPPAPATQSTK